MTLTHLSSLAADAAPALANHLWQSTAFAAAIWLLTLLLRNNHARIRHTLWLAASIKFLLPFSLLITLGTLLPKPQQIAPPTTIYSAIDTASQPFTQFDTSIAPATPTPTLKDRLTAQLPAALAILWLCGALTVLLLWYTRWRQVHATLKKSIPITAGREHEILRRLQTQSAPHQQITLLRSPDLMEPGIFGILRPTLLWPHRLSDQLEDAHIEAILAHETIHVRRRDNLTAALHMLVEAAFWFHPIVWWMERRMIEERERACDEAVVQQGGNPETYAESLLKACRFCLESPLPCVAGITGADLSRRVRSIMTLQLERLGAVKKLLLVATGIAALAGPLAFGVMRMAPLHVQILHATDPMPSYEVATVRPWDGSGYSGRPLRTVIQDAFNIPPHAVNRLIGPNWINTKSYVIQGKIPDSLQEAMRKMPLAEQWKERQLLTQSLLADRFKLKVHFETREMPIFELVQAKGGAKLKESTRPASENGGSIMGPRGQLTHSRALNASVDNIIAMLMMDSQIDGHTIIDKTGLTGRYDVVLDWLPSRLPAVATPGSLIQPDAYGPPPAPGTEGPSLFTALQEQLGLRLIATKGPSEIVVIDHIEQPSSDPGGEAPPTPTQPAPPAPKAPPQAAAPPPASPSAPARTPEFDVVSIKPIEPGGRSTTGYVGVMMDSPDSVNAGFVTLDMLMRGAYGYRKYYIESQVAGVPDWAKKQRYNIEAKLSEADIAEFATLSKQERQHRKELMLQAMLADRFHLKIHLETKQIPIYELIIGKGFHLQPAGENDPAVIKTRSGKPMEGSRIWMGPGDRATIIQRNSMEQIASFLTSQARELDRPVMDKTGLTGNYTFTLDSWSPMISMMIQQGKQADDMSTIFMALQQQGLKLQPSTGTIEVLAIDHVDHPSEN